MSTAFPLSILDLAPIPEGETAAEALKRLSDLARLGDRLGYNRIWYAEHHGLPHVAAAVPELMIAHAAQATHHIRVGAGGIMLPNHVPLKVVESFRTLAALHAGRIDLGIGRAGGTDGRTMQALRSTRGEEFSHELAELLAFEGGSFPQGHPFGAITVTPQGSDLPPIWLLGSSGASAQLAGKLGMGYAFAGHFSHTPARPAFKAYRDSFTPSATFAEPQAILCLQAICAPTQEEAEYLAGSMFLAWVQLRTNVGGLLPSPQTAATYDYSRQEQAIADDFRKLMIIGDPQTAKAEIAVRVEQAGATEAMVTTNIYDPALRLRSFQLLAEAFGLGRP